MVHIEFYTFKDEYNPMDKLKETIIDSISLNYTDNIKFNVNKKDDECSLTINLDFLNNIEDVDIFVLEEICHENEIYVQVYDSNTKKEFYYDESDEWIYKDMD